MLWWKAVHIIAVISWMAGILYLFRLFIYHNLETEDVCKTRFMVMERRLFNIIATPAMLLVVASGLMTARYDFSYYFKVGWFHAKLAAVLILIGVHFWSLRIRKRLANEDHPYSDKGLRILNEVPTLLMIIIVILAVLKPF